jgi:long-subunit fatty acid transport protein
MASVLAMAPLAAAQPTERRDLGTPPLQYNFSPPGARALAMGAAFIGLADDATASESNPAGLTILTRPEFSAHFRFSSLDNPAPDTVNFVGFKEFNDKVGSPGFFSFVYPWKQAAFSVYFQRSADYRAHSLFDGLVPTQDFGDLPDTDQVETDLKVDNYGLSGAFKLGSRVSVGASARITRLHLQSLQQASFQSTESEDFPGNIVRDFVALDAAKSEFTWNAGLLFTPVSKITIGGVYKKGASYDFATNQMLQVITIEAGTENFPGDPVAVAVTIPDSYGGGLAIRPTESWTIAADVVRVRYSQQNRFRPNGELVTNFYQDFGEGGGEALEDETEFHLGTEYTWAAGSDWIFAVRGGYYSDPDHDGLPGIDTKQDHVTFGGGVVIKGKLQIDVAANLAKHVKEGLISVVARF